MIRVLVVDDHAILRDGIRSLLESQDDIVVVGEACDGAEAFEYTGKLNPDIVLMDISMPNTNGLEATRLIKEHFPHVKVLILTQHDSREYIAPALIAGASGYVLKRSGRREMLDALRQVYEHGSFITSHIAQEILQAEPHPNRKVPGDGQHLTERERQTLKLIVEGKSNKEIEQSLFIAASTIKNHVSAIYAKLGINSRGQLMNLVLKMRKKER